MANLENTGKTNRFCGVDKVNGASNSATQSYVAMSGHSMQSQPEFGGVSVCEREIVGTINRDCTKPVSHVGVDLVSVNSLDWTVSPATSRRFLLIFLGPSGAICGMSRAKASSLPLLLRPPTTGTRYKLPAINPHVTGSVEAMRRRAGGHTPEQAYRWTRKPFGGMRCGAVSDRPGPLSPEAKVQ